MSDDEELETAPGPASKDQPAEGGRDINQDETSAGDVGDQSGSSDATATRDAP